MKATAAAYLRTFAPLPDGVCPYKDPVCKNVLESFMENAEKNLRSVTLPNPLVLLLSTCAFADTGSPELCGDCMVAVYKRQEKQREQMWKELPALFGVEAAS